MLQGCKYQNVTFLRPSHRFQFQWTANVTMYSLFSWVCQYSFGVRTLERNEKREHRIELDCFRVRFFCRFRILVSTVLFRSSLSLCYVNYDSLNDVLTIFFCQRRSLLLLFLFLCSVFCMQINWNRSHNQLPADVILYDDCQWLCYFTMRVKMTDSPSHTLFNWMNFWRNIFQFNYDIYHVNDK